MSVKVGTKEELNKAINDKQKEIIIDNNELAKQFIRREKIKKVIFITSILILIILCIIIFIYYSKWAPPIGTLGLPVEKGISKPLPTVWSLINDLPGSLLLIGFGLLLLGGLIFYALHKGYNVRIETEYGKVVLERK